MNRDPKFEPSQLLRLEPVRYGLALVAVGLGFLLRLTLTAWVGEGLPLYITYYPAVMVVALAAGFGPGVLTTMVSLLVVNHWTLPPSGQFVMGGLQDLVAQGLFGCMGAFISAVAELYRRSRRQVANYEHTLALREVSLQRGLALEASGFGTWDYRFQTGEVFWDERCRNMWGIDEGRAIDYAAAIKQIHPDDAASVEAALKEAIAGTDDGAYRREFRVVQPDGSWRWISSNGRVMFEGEGPQRRALRFIGITADITERKAVEAELREARRELEARIDEQTLQIRQANESLERRVAERTAELEAVNASLEESRGTAIDLLEDATASRLKSEQATEALRREGAERQQAQESLVRIQREWERTFDTVPDLIAILDDRYRITRVNQAMARRMGMTPEQCLNRPCFECVHGMKQPPGNCPHSLTLADGLEHSTEVYDERMGGYFHVTTTPFKDEQGRTVGSVHVARDITEQKRAEQALRENQERLMLAQRAGRVGVFDVDLQSNTCRWSDEKRAIFGVPATFEATPESWASLIHPDDRPKTVARRERACRERHPEFHLTYRVLRPDGQVRWVEERGAVTYDAAGRPLRLVGTSVDVTTQQGALDALRHVHKRFRHSASRAVILLAVCIFLAEFAVMFMLPLFPAMPVWLEALVDASAMLVLATPVLHLFAFRPLYRLLKERQRAEEALRQANLELDERVRERTASLERASLELRQSQRDLTHAQEVAHIGNWRLDVRRNELLWSDENHRIFGLPKGTPLTYETFLSTVLPEDREYVDCKWTAALHGAPYDIEHRLLVEGQVKWVREVAELEFDPQGGLLGGFGTTQDITAFKHAEAARRESEERLRQAMQVSRMFTFEWEPRTDRVQRSPHCAQILGLTEEQAIRDTGSSFFERVHPDDSPRFQSALDHLCPEADTYHLKYRCRRPDGPWVVLEETARAFFDAQGRLDRLVGLAADVTAREQIQETVQWELAVNQSLTSLSQAALDPEATIEKVAQCVLAQALDLTGSRDAVVSYLNPTTGEAICHARLTAVRNGEPVTEARRYTCAPSADGTLPPLPQPLEDTAVDVAQESGARLVSQPLLITPVHLGRVSVGHIVVAKPREPLSQREADALKRLAAHYALAIQLMRFKQDLEAERDFVQAILATAGALVMVLDTQGRIVRFNRTCEQITGFTFPEVAHKPFFEVGLVPEERAAAREEFSRLLAGAPPHHHENHWRCKDGALRRITWSDAVLRDDRNAVQYVISAGLDVTQIRAAEDKLRVLSRAIEAGPASVVITDRQGAILYVNPTFAQLTGYSPKEVIGQNPRLWKSGHHPPQYYASMWQTLLQGEEWQGEFCNKNKSGKRFWIYATISPIRDETGVISQFVAVTVDITERKNIEAALLQARQDLELKVTERTEDLKLTIQDLHQEIEARRRVELEIQTMLQFERVISDISAAFANLSPGRFEQVLREGIHSLMTFFGADRAALAEFVGTDINLTVQCHGESVEAVEGSLTAREFPWAVACLHRQQQVVFKSLDELASPAPVDRQTFLKHGTKSMLAVPLVVGQEVLGALIFSNVLRERDWPSVFVQRMRLVGDLFAGLVMHWRSEQALSETETRYRTLADFMQDWDYWESPEGNLLFCSPACERITGYGPQRFLVQPSLLHEIVVPEDAGLWVAHHCGRFESDTPRHLEFRIRRADGKICWIEHYCQSVRDAEGRFMGVRVSNRDHTDVKMSELETQLLREDLTHISRTTMANQLAASLAHELRQPLSAVMSNAEAALQFLGLQPPEIDEVRDALQDIVQNNERASDVIKHLRALYRKTGIDHQPLNLNRLIGETVDLLRSEMVLRHVSCRLDLARDLPEISGNRVELQQVIMNLVFNAMDAMAQFPPEERRLGIRTTQDETGEVRVEVRDAGAGIGPNVLDRLFQPFVTTKTSGMGMGLSVSHTIIAAHGGHIHAANNPDRGATFCFTLPVNIVSPEA